MNFKIVFMTNKIIKIFAFIFIIIVLDSCATNKVQEAKTAEETYKQAMILFKDGDYLEAKTAFNKIKLQFPASQYADDAQYYIAGCNFNREEYILASYNYNLLRRVYPSSQYYKISLFKAGQCYYYSSPPFDRDQDYTKKAISTLSEFQTLYPNDSLALITKKLIQELRDKLGRREYETAELYTKLRYPESALIYFNTLIEDYYDTKYYEDAYLGKIKALLVMRRYQEAQNSIDLYYSIFKDGKHKKDIQKIESSIKNQNK